MNGLFGSAILEVAIGLIFVYLLLALICTAVNEWVLSYLLKTRSKTLRRTLQALLSGQPMGDRDFYAAFDQHALIVKTKDSAGRDGPSYIPAGTFSTAIIDLLTPKIEGPVTFEDVWAGVKSMPEGAVKDSLLALMTRSRADLDNFRKRIEEWFDSAMDRASGVFKRHAQAWAIAVASLVTLVTNADTLAISRTLWQNSTVRAQIVALAEKRAAVPRPTGNVEYKDADDPLNPTFEAEPQNSLTEEERAALGKLMGWEKPLLQYRLTDLVPRLPGWILTAIAVSLGAPFWFDVLNRFMRVRNAGKVPEKSADEETKKGEDKEGK